MKSRRRKHVRAQLAKAREKARRFKAAAGFRSAYELALFDKGRALSAELGASATQAAWPPDSDIADFFNPAKPK